MLFGGRIAVGDSCGTGTVFCDDTWEWDGEDWVEKQPAASPSSRYGASAAWDAPSGRVLLFGGGRGWNARLRSDTWDWDGEQWRQREPQHAPPASQGGGMVWDAAAERMLLVIGWTEPCEQGGTCPDVWQWEGDDWDPLDVSGDLPTWVAFGTAWDEASGALVLFGGTNGPWDPVGSGTWLWEGQDWRRADLDVRPPARTLHAAAWDGERDRVLVFGGKQRGEVERLQDTWAWNGRTWQELSSRRTPGRRDGHAMAYEPRNRRAALHGGCREWGGTIFDRGCQVAWGDDWRWSGSRWSSTGLDPAPGPRLFSAMATATDGEGVVLFGGSPTGDAGDDLWRTTADGWERLEPAVSPPARQLHAMALDEDRGRVVLFGGTSCGDNGSRCGDIWEWTGEEWIEREGGEGPAARSAHGLAHDVVRGRTVLFGGMSTVEGACPDVDSRCDDVWEWDGERWWRREPTVHPSPRQGSATVWDAARREVVVFGGDGCAADAECGDTWTYGPAHLVPHLVVGFDLRSTQTLEPSVADPSTRLLHGVSVRAVGGGVGHTLGTGRVDGEAVPGWRVSVSSFGYGGWTPLYESAALPEALDDWQADYGLDWRSGEAGSARASIDRWPASDGRLYLDLAPLEAQGAAREDGGVALDYVELRLRYRRTGDD